MVPSIRLRFPEKLIQTCLPGAGLYVGSVSHTIFMTQPTDVQMHARKFCFKGRLSYDIDMIFQICDRNLEGKSRSVYLEKRFLITITFLHIQLVTRHIMSIVVLVSVTFM